MDGPYARWSAHRFDILFPPLQEFVYLLPHISLHQRKVLLTMTRCQVSPSINSRLFQRYKAVWNSYIRVPDYIVDRLHTPHYTLRLLALRLTAYLTPLRSGLLSMLIRNAPLADPSDAIVARDASIMKEIQAALNKHHPVSLDYSSIMSLDLHHTSRLAYNTPLAPETSTEIHYSLIAAGRSLTQRILYPACSTKTIGVICRKNAEILQNNYHPTEILSTADLERYYHQTGFRLSGPSEVRVAWTYNILSPRVYFAQGSDVYYDSRYIQAVFNILVDALGITHRFTRFHPQSVSISKDDLAYIYDYSSFTSSLHEIRNFCHQLTLFFKGTPITLLDTHDGIITTDLGRVLEDWNQSCNIDPSFDTSQLFDLDTFEGIFTHNCGMLGVPGNISSCTLLHGIHLAIVLESLATGKVIGDDAFLVFSREMKISGYDTITMKQALLNLGEVAVEKVEKWDVDDVEDEDTWHYTKRPIVRVSEDRMYFGKQIIWPSLANALDLHDKMHRTSPDDTLGARQKKYANQVFRFLVSTQELGEPTPEDQELVSLCLRSWHHFLHIPWNGSRPSPSMPFWIPSSQWSGDFILQGVEDMSACVISIPKEFVKGFALEVSGIRGAEFTYKAIPPLTMMVKLGYMERKVVRETILVSDHWELVQRFLARKEYGSYLYTYTVLSDCPSWLYQLLDLSHVPHENISVDYDQEEDGITDVLEFVNNL